MAQKYYYDPDTCTFVEADDSQQKLLKRGALAAVAVVVVAALLAWGMDLHLVETPEELALKSENEALKEQLERASNRMDMLAQRLDHIARTDRELYRTLLQAEPISKDVRQVGVGGTDSYKDYDRFDQETASLLRKTSRTLDQLERQMSLQSASFRELTQMAQSRERELEQLPAIRPANGPITSGYGKRYHPVLKVRKMHTGVDFLLEKGSPVVAPGDGIVKRTGRSATYGRYVDLKHPAAGYTTRFAHLSKIPAGIRRGRHVERGDTIAYSGNSGRSTGPHLHYEVRDSEGRTLNPAYFFAPDMTPNKYQKLLAKTERLGVAPG